MLRYLILALALLAGTAAAQSKAVNSATESSREVGPYTVHFTVFPSTFVPAEIASRHGLTRAGNRSLINIAVADRATGKPVKAAVTGTAKNLMQQQKPLEFLAIDESDAHYAIASLRHSQEELFHFALNIAPEGGAQGFPFEFSRILYLEN